MANDMPVYEVELDGHRYQIEGERPPTEADVRAALGSQKPVQEETPGVFETLGRSAAAGLAPSAAAAAAFVPGMAVGAPFSEFAGPAAPAVPLITGAGASLLAGGAVEFGQEKLLEKYAPGFLKKLQTGAQAHPIAAGIGRVASAAPAFTIAPGQAIEGAISLPRVLRGEAIDAEKQAAKALFAQLGAQTGITAAQAGLEEHRLPTAGELLESAAAGVIYGHPRFSLPIPKTLQKGLIDYASRQRKAAEIHGDVRTQPETGLPEQEGRPRVQPRPEAQAQGLGKEAQVPLNIRLTGSDFTGYSIHINDKTESGFKTREEAEEALQAIAAGERELQTRKEAQPVTPLEEEKPLAPGEFDIVNQMERAAVNEGENVGTPITPVDKFTATEDENVPFAGVYLSATGKGAELHRGEFRRQINFWLSKGFKPDQIKEMVISAVNEERLHNDVMANATKAEVEGHWNDFTRLEQMIEHYIYHGSTKPRKFDTPYRMGHEAIRRRLQKAMKLPVREFLETVGRERWKLKGLDALGSMVRKSRELLGTSASERQRRLYDRVLGNLDAAKAMLATGQMGPGASRREEPEERITAAAVVGPNGTVETGANHPEILDRLGIKGFEKAESRNTPDFGFQTDRRPFITREEAGPLAERSGQALKEFEPGEPVHSDEVAAAGTKTPISELGPGASRREREREREREQGQAEMYGPKVKGLGSQLPPVPPEQRQVPLETPRTPLEQAAQHIFEGRLPPLAAREGQAPEAVEPSFREFFKWAKRNVSESVQSGPMFDIWLDTVNRNLERAPGAKLNELIENLGIQSRVYPWKKQYAGAPKDYTRIEVPDYRAIPPDPNRLPMAVEQAIRDRVAATPMFEEGTMSEEELAKAQDKAVEKARKEVVRYYESITTERERETQKMERQGAMRGQKLRMKALSAIFQKMIEEGAPTITELSPKDITWEDIAWNNPNAKDFGAYYTIRPEDRTNPDKLHEIFHEEARRNKYETLSHTRKLAVLLNRKSGQVALVSAYPVPKSRGSVRIVEPSGATGKLGKPNVAIDSALRRGWEPILAILKKEPVKDFYKGFKDIDDYNRYLGTDAAQAESRSRESMDVGLRPDDVHEDIPEFATTQDWQERQMAMEPTEHDLATIIEEQQRPTEEFIGPQPSEPVGEEFRPGTAVERGEGGMFTGPEAGEARMAAGQMWRSRPLSVAEAMAVHNYLNDPDEWAAGAIAPEVAAATTREGMQQALQRLYDMASNNRLKPRQWTIISALRKMALERYLRDRKEFREMLLDEREAIRKLPKAERAAARAALEQFRPTAEGSMAAALNRIYEINQTTDTQGDYLAQVMGEFTSPAPEVKTPTTTERPTGARELATPRFARRAVPAESLPADYGRRTEPSPGDLLTPEGAQFVAAEAAKEYKYDPKLAFESLPVFEIAKSKGNITDYEIQAAFRLMRPSARRGYIEGPVTRKRTELGPGASIREVTDWTAAEWDRISTYIKKVVTDPLFRKEQAQELRAGTRKYAEVPYKRATTEHDINAAADGADHQVEMYSNRLANQLRADSVKPGAEPKKPTLLQRFFKPVLYSKEAVRVREITKAVPAAFEELNNQKWNEIFRAWKEAIAEWKPVQDEARRKHEKVPDMPQEMRPVYKRPTYEELKPEHFERAIVNAEEGVRRATEQLKSPTAVQRIIARRWLKAAERLLGEAKEAQKRFNEPEVRRTYETYQAIMDQHLNNMNRHGMNISGRDYYVPGRYEGQMWADNAILWGDMRIIGRQFRLPKTMKNYYAAIKEGHYIPVNYDIADLAQHSLAAGGKIMARDAWIEGLKNFIDPESGQPVAIEPAWGKFKPVEMTQEAFDQMVEQMRKDVGTGKAIPQEVLMSLLRQMGVTKKPFGFQVPEGKQDYQLVWPTINSKPMAVRVGYRKVVETVMARSQVRDLPILGQALTASQMMKHGLILIIDTFHPGRLAQYSLALAGKNPHAAYRNGISALMWSPESLDQAVHIGAISKESADWARTEIKLHDGDQVRTMTRQDLLRMMVSRGLNASQTADTLYRNSIQRIPWIGNKWNALLSPLNKWIFERITPGLIAESAVRDLEKVNPKARGVSLDAQIREVVRDTNVFYGNLGRNGIFKHPTARDLAQILLLAPLWQEGLINKELRTIARVTQLSRLAGRTGLPPSLYYGSLTRGMVRGLAAYFILTQMINLATRRKWSFQNEEEGHKMDAWLPIGGQGAWLSPLSVFGEVMHDLIRFGETKPKTWDAVTQFGRNKLGPIGRLAWILAEGKSPTGEDITTTGGVLGRAARELAPTPISVGTFAQAAMPGVFGKPRPGAVGQRLISSVGIKTQLADRTETQVRRLASAFVKQHNLTWEPLEFTPTDQASYAKLRGALRNDDEASAARTLKELRQHRSNAQILKAMRLASERPFAGSKSNETMFLYSLNNDQLDQYFKASLQRAEDYQKFLDFYTRQP